MSALPPCVHYPPLGLPLFQLNFCFLKKVHVRHKVVKARTVKKEQLFVNSTNLLNPPLHQACKVCHYLIHPLLNPHWHLQSSPTHSEAAWHCYLIPCHPRLNPQRTFPTHLMALLSYPAFPLLFHMLYRQLPSLILVALCLRVSPSCPSPTAWSFSQSDSSKSFPRLLLKSSVWQVHLTASIPMRA